MANMTFKANLLPNTDLGYSLGSSTLRWKINGANPDDIYVNVSGDTMTGDLTIAKTSAVVSQVKVKNSTGSEVSLHMAASGNQGVYSSGYWNGSTYTVNGNWIIYRGTNNQVAVPLWASIGGTAKPVYFNGSGTPVAISATVGGTAQPAFLSSGTITACSATVGSGIKPVFMNSDTITVSDSTVGSGAKPIFLSSGTITASSSTVGGGEQPIYMNAGTLSNTTYALKATVNNGTANRLVYYSTARALSEAAGLNYIRQNNSKSATQTILHIQGQTYGNDAAYMLSGTAGLFQWGDGGPQITFDTTATPGGGQAGALIFTDHDTAAPGASFHFVSNQSDWNVTSKRFHAKTNISIGSNLPVTSHNLFVTGTSKFTSHVYNAGHVYFANGTTYYINNTGSFNLNGGSIVLGDLWLRNNGVLQIDHRTTTKAVKTIYTAGYLRFKNSANSVEYGSPWLRYVGTDGTDGYNTCLVYGSGNGTTWIGAGESSGTMPTTLSKYNDENLYLSADGAINFYSGCANDASSYKLTLECRTNGYAYATRLYGAVWNDYAEMRQSNIIEPGRCVKETGDGNLILSTKRLERGCNIISDTYGFAIGETEKCKTPIAVSGRVLAYCYEGQEEARKWIGYGVCSGPNGTVSIMTEEEERLYPNMIIGTISEIPNYDTWQAGSETNSKNIIIDGRIWIKVK